MEDIRHRSVSQLKTFTRCPEQYRLERVVKVPEAPAAWTAAGHAFHSAYENWEEEGRRQQLADLFEDEYNLEIASLMLRHPDLNKWGRAPNVKSTEQDIKLRRTHGIKCAEVYQKHCLVADWRPYRVEWPFEIKFGSVLVHGIVDVILEWPDGSYTIRDIKTGNREVDNRQLGVYAAAVRKFLNLPVQWGEYWYTKDGGNRAVDLSRYTTEYLTDQFEALDRAIESQNFVASPGKQCDLCSVKPYCREMGWTTIA